VLFIILKIVNSEWVYTLMVLSEKVWLIDE
jgi:hypothetical protein